MIITTINKYVLLNRPQQGSLIFYPILITASSMTSCASNAFSRSLFLSFLSECPTFSTLRCRIIFHRLPILTHLLDRQLLQQPERGREEGVAVVLRSEEARRPWSRNSQADARHSRQAGILRICKSTEITNALTPLLNL